MTSNPYRQSLDIAREAVAVRRLQAGVNPTTGRLAELASALTEFGDRLRIFGEYEDAFAVLRESLQLWDKVAETAPDAYRHERAEAEATWRKANYSYLCGND